MGKKRGGGKKKERRNRGKTKEGERNINNLNRITARHKRYESRMHIWVVGNER